MGLLEEMKKLFYGIFIFLFLLPIRLYARGPTNLNSKLAHLSLTAKVGKLSGDERLLLSCSLENIGESSVNLFFVPFLNIKVFIKNREGEKELKNIILPRIRVSKEQIINLKQGEHYSFNLNLTKDEYKWPQSGDYEAWVIYDNKNQKIEKVRLWTGRVQSNIFQIQFQ